MTEIEANLELPFKRSWWIEPGRIIGGRFPGTPQVAETKALLARLVDVGVRLVINLQEADERGGNGSTFPDYREALAGIAGERGVQVRTCRLSVPDMGLPEPTRMQEILDAIHAAVNLGGRVYVHCWGGHGRTGTVAGCWLIGSGMSFEETLQHIERARVHDPHLAKFPSPQTAAQRQFVREWRGGVGTCARSG